MSYGESGDAIAIIGTGCRFPGGVNNLDEFWQLLSRGEDAIVPLNGSRWQRPDLLSQDPQPGYSYATEAGLIEGVDQFDSGFFAIPTEEANAMDPQQRILLETCVHALEQAGVLADKTLLTNTGLCVGLSTDDYGFMNRDIVDGKNATPYNTLGNMRSIAAGRLAYFLNLHGPVVQLDTACSSSLVAVHNACQQLILGEADCMLAAGVNLILSPRLMVALSQLKALSPSNRCHVFDQKADGYVRGEGCGVVVLKRLQDALEHGDTVLAVIESSAVNHDGASNGLTAPNGVAQQQVIKKALSKSGCGANAVNYVEAHGTGTLFGDPIEVNSLSQCYLNAERQDNPLYLGSVKSNLGHLEAAAGMAGLLKLVACLEQKSLVPSLNFTDPNPHINWHNGQVVVADRTMSWPLPPGAEKRRACISAFGFSGTNVHMLVAEYTHDPRQSPDQYPSIDQYQSGAVNKGQHQVYLLPLSAPTETMLKARVKQWLGSAQLAGMAFENLAYTASVHRPHYKKRLLVAAANEAGLKQALSQWLQQPDSELNTWQEKVTDSELLTLGQNYLSGKKVDWQTAWTDKAARICPLPAIPFSRKRHWLQDHEILVFSADKAQQTATLDTVETREVTGSNCNANPLISEHAYQLTWQHAELSRARLNRISAPWEIIDLWPNEQNRWRSLLNLGVGLDVSSVDEHINQLHQKGESAAKPLLLWADLSGKNSISKQGLSQKIQILWKAIENLESTGVPQHVWILLHQSHNTDSVNRACVEAMVGVVNSLRQECHSLQLKTLCVESDRANPWPELSALALQLVAQTTALWDDNDLLRLREGRIWQPRFTPLSDTAKPQRAQSVIEEVKQAEGYILITGGLGALGQAIADDYAARGVTRFILLSRRTEAQISDKRVLANLARWRQLGIDVRVDSADVADPNQLSTVFTQWDAQNITVAGIVHCAGVIERAGLGKLPSAEQIQASFDAKLFGAQQLIELGLARKTGFVLLFSSVTSILGIKDLGLYAGANNALSELAIHYHSEGHRVLAADLGRFELEGLMEHSEAKILEHLGVHALPLQACFHQLNRLLQSGSARVALAKVDWDKFLPFYHQSNTSGLLSAVLQNESASVTSATPSINTQDHVFTQSEQLAVALAQVVSQQLNQQLGEQERRTNLFSLGLNSLLALSIRQKIEEITGLVTEPTLFFQHQSVDDVALHLWTRLQSDVSEHQEINVAVQSTKQVLMFSGQGSQYAGMGQSLYQAEPIFQRHVDQCCELLSDKFERDFRDVLFNADVHELNQTQFSQPALFVIEYSLGCWLKEQGVAADYLMGHSVGEYAAACLAGVFSLADALELICIRGRLMQALPEGGGMTAVYCDEFTLPPLPAGLSVAAFNGPLQTVISGSSERLTQYQKQLKSQKILYQRLAAGYAFHSELMQPVLNEFKRHLDRVKFSAPSIPIVNNVFATSDGGRISSPEYWLAQITQAVNFSACLQTCTEQGVTRFLEVGPGQVLEGITRQTLEQVPDLNTEHTLSAMREKHLDWHGILSSWRTSTASVPQRQSALAPFLIHNPEPENPNPFVLTDMQHAYWLGRHKEIAGGEVAIHMYLELDIDNLHVERLENAWNQLIQRHPMLRAVVTADGQQRILSDVHRVSFPVRNFRGDPYPDTQCALEEIRRHMSHQVADLSVWPQSDIRISQLEKGKSRVHFSLDGWCIDGWSYQILFHELHALYRDPSIQLKPLNVGFKDYVGQLAQLEHSEMYQQRLQWWQGQLPDFPMAPQLPKGDQSNPSNQFKRWQQVLSSDTYHKLEIRAAQHHLTPATTMLAAYAWILSRFSEQPDICLNVPRFNRLPLHEDVNRLVGEFASFTLLPCRRQHNTHFLEFAQQLQTSLWQDLEQPWVPGVTLLREYAKAKGGSQLNLPFVFTNMPEESLDGNALEMLNTWKGDAQVGYFLTQTPQVWIDCQYHRHDLGLLLFWDVLEQQFAPGVIDHLFNAYIELINQLAHEHSDWQFIPRLNVSHHHDLNRSSDNSADTGLSLVEGSQGPLMAGDGFDFIHQFEIQVENNPQKIALISSQTQLNYRQLHAEVLALCERLQPVLVDNPEVEQSVVALKLNKGRQQLVAMLAIHACGAIALPVDPELPDSRLNYMLEHARACVLLSDTDVFNLDVAGNLTCIALSEQQATGGELDQNLASLARFNHPKAKQQLSMIIYTSGSTGTPKGVMVGTAGLQHAVHYTLEQFEINSDDCLLGLTPLHHDMALFDIFGTVACGATLVLPDAAKRKDPVHWLNLIHQHQISIWNSVPAMMDMLLAVTAAPPTQLQQEQVASLRLCFLGGDWIPLNLPDRLSCLNANTQLVSVGGPTETTLWNIVYPVSHVEPLWRSVPYGRPISHTRYQICNALSEPCLEGVAGEMWVSGVGVAAGYLADTQRTAESFVQKKSQVWYRTGDLGCVMPDGNIEFVGRRDNQINISGYRMELTEIERALLAHPLVDRAQVVVQQHNGQKRLVCACCSKSSNDLSWSQLRTYLSGALPAQMIPKEGVLLDALPLTANGKVDTKAILALISSQQPQTASPVETSQNPVEQALMGLWKQNLNTDTLSVDDNYFEAGGNSLLATELFVSMAARFPQLQSVVNLYEFPSIRTLAEFIQPTEKAEATHQQKYRGQLRRKKQLARKQSRNTARVQD